MKPWRVLLLLLLTAAVFPASPLAPDVLTWAKRVDQHYNQLRSLQAEFTETYQGAGVERTESGTLWLKKPGRMRWEYHQPREKLFVTDGKEAWFYTPGDRQARRTSFRKLEDLRSPLAFLLGRSSVVKELAGLSWAPDVTPRFPGNRVLRGFPRGQNQGLTEVLLEISPAGRLDRIVAMQTDASVTTYEFMDQRADAPLAEDQFRFQPPKGVEVVTGELAQ